MTTLRSVDGTTIGNGTMGVTPDDDDDEPVDWERISAALRAPFDPEEVEFRVQGRANEQGRAQVVAYIDARCVQDRLDDVVGAENWSFDWEPILIENGQLQLAKGTLTILGVSKSDIGSASNFEQSLGCVSHVEKRAGVQWGIGRYLYELGATWVNVEKGGRIPDTTLRTLRGKLPQPTATAPTPAHIAKEDRQPAPAQSDDELTTQPETRHAAPQTTPQQRAQAQHNAPRPQQARSTPDPNDGQPLATAQQWSSIRKLSEVLKRDLPEPGLSYEQARGLISALSKDYQTLRKAQQQSTSAGK